MPKRHERDIRLTLAENLQALKRWSRLDTPGFAAKTGLSYMMARRLLREGAEAATENYPGLDKLEAIAAAYDIWVWQLLVPGMRPEKDRRPVCVVSERHRRLIQASDEPDEAVSPLTEEVAREIEREHDNDSSPHETVSPTPERRTDPKVPAARKAGSPKRKRVTHK